MVLEVLMVPKAGLEPARISTVDFESTASTDFATSALKGMRKRSGLYLSAAVMQATACRHCAFLLYYSDSADYDFSYHSGCLLITYTHKTISITT